MKHRLFTYSTVFSAILLVGWYIFAVPTTSATTYDLHINVVDPDAPTDVCPNIPGIQTAIPDGMQHDINGYCYTPSQPPNPEIPTDLCTNIDGIQTILPTGYYRDSDGTCYEQPAPPAEPRDVCPNIDGIQGTVPADRYMDADGNCLASTTTATDICPNIDGVQASLPDGMKRDSKGNCYTPSTTSQNTNADGTGAKYKNVPEFFTPLIDSLVSLIPKPMQEWLKSLPESVARTVPYYIFGFLGILILIPLLQSLREALFVRQLIAILKRERDIAEQKDNFITLASHYIRTPLTLMASGIDTVISLGESTAEAVAPLQTALNSLNDNLKRILGDIENSTTLKNISKLDKQPVPPAAWRSPFFWIPVVASIVLTLLANFLLGVVGDKELGTGNLILQSFVAIVVIFMLYAVLRNRHNQKRLRIENEALITHEKNIDDARNSFIEQSTRALRKGLQDIDAHTHLLDHTSSGRFFTEGYGRLEAILKKFLLLSHVQTGVQRSLKPINIRKLVDESLSTHQAALTEKNLSVTNAVPSALTVQQSPTLFRFVIDSIIDNAIKFNVSGGRIRIDAHPKKATVSLTVIDSGIGIDEEKLGQLFKPFSRMTSSIEFDYEGLGFSLFLDKIIMDYTGGSITAASPSDSGAKIAVTTNPAL